MGLRSDIQLRVPHASQQARRALLQRPHAVPGVPLHSARLHQRDGGPAGPKHLQVSARVKRLLMFGVYHILSDVDIQVLYSKIAPSLS